MILYCKDSLDCIDKNNIELINNYLLLRDDFRLGLVISPRAAVLAFGLASPQANTAVRGLITRPISPKANTVTLGLITRPMRKSSRNDIYILINHKMGIYKIDIFIN